MISRAVGTGRVCALTFDDGPNGSTTSRLLDFLSVHGIHAVFCVVGRNILTPGGAELLRRMAAEGHLLASHSMNHVDMGNWSRSVIHADLSQTVTVVRQALRDESFAVPFFRAPFGSWGQTESVASELGMRSLAVVNTIDDWTTENPDALVNNLRTAMKPGELVLAHDGGGPREATVDAIIAVVTERLAEGWTFTLPAED
ncbi:MAG TPA: polysaccharide deacetylase family protein [Galbitalea sp.]